MRPLSFLPLCALFLFASTGQTQCPNNTDCVTITKPINGTGPGPTTTTTYDNSAHREAAAQQASALTRAGLNYFLIGRPALETAANEARHRRDGQFSWLYESLDQVSSTAMPKVERTSDTEPSIKQHVLGEPWATFLAKSNYLASRAKACDALKRPSPTDKKAYSHFNPCSALWMMKDNPQADLTLDCLDSFRGASKTMVCQDFSGEISFRKGVLVELKLIVPGELSTTLPDIVQKFGPPDGGDKDQSLAVWNTTTYSLVALSYQDTTAISWMTPAEVTRLKEAAERQTKDLGNAKNALD